MEMTKITTTYTTPKGDGDGNEIDKDKILTETGEGSVHGDKGSDLEGTSTRALKGFRQTLTMPNEPPALVTLTFAVK
jgi:hypothetical protein